MNAKLSEVALPIIYLAQVNGMGFDPAVFTKQIIGHKPIGEIRSAPVDPCPQHDSRRGRKMIRDGIQVVVSDELTK